jgi:hypothetical protein
MWLFEVKRCSLVRGFNGKENEEEKGDKKIKKI